jgi:hypothetical protein
LETAVEFHDDPEVLPPPIDQLGKLFPRELVKFFRPVPSARTA